MPQHINLPTPEDVAMLLAHGAEEYIADNGSMHYQAHGYPWVSSVVSWEITYDSDGHSAWYTGFIIDDVIRELGIEDNDNAYGPEAVNYIGDLLVAAGFNRSKTFETLALFNTSDWNAFKAKTLHNNMSTGILENCARFAAQDMLTPVQKRTFVKLGMPIAELMSQLKAGVPASLILELHGAAPITEKSS